MPESPTTPPEATPPIEETPKMPPPSATIEQFDSGGGPPPPAPAAPKKNNNVVVPLLIMILAAAGGAYFYFQHYAPGAKTKATPTVTPTPATSVGDLENQLKQVDTDATKADDTLTGTDTALGDKQGDLSE